MLKRIKKLLFIACLLIAIFAVAHFALAVDVWGNDPNGANFSAVTGLGGTDIRVTIANAIRLVIGFLGIIAVVLIIYAGFIWMTAAGQADKIDKAKKILTGALIGLVLILFSFAIATFILNSLIDVTGGNQPASCNGGPACSGSDVCCSTGCQLPPCSSIVPDTFIVARTIPDNQAVNVIRNVVVKVFFNDILGNSVDQAMLNSHLQVNKTDDIDPNTLVLTPNPGAMVGAREFINGRRAVTFKNNANCGDEKNTPNCFPAWSKFRVTVDPNSIVSINSKPLVCNLSFPCEFVFSTNNLIDTSGPTAGIVPTQICQDDGSFMKPDANTVTGWGRDDVGISGLNFYYRRLSNPLDSLDLAVPGNSLTYQQADNKYDTAAWVVDDTYNLKLQALDMADQQASSSFNAIIRKGHCCNGIKDSGESDVDCGGECGACEGAACANDLSVPLTCSNSLCASQFCTPQNSDQTQCAAAGYDPAVQSCCLCRRQPVITGVFPVGGFCDGSPNTPCLVNGDCTAAPNTCNKTIPNGAAGNFVTIIGKNFGTTVGTTTFSSNQTASLASTVNANCINSWQDNQIIVVVPAGAVNGPISVETASGFSDDTTLNPALPPFLINTISRPGLCQLTPAQGAMNTAITYYGIRLGGEFRFGDSQNYVLAFNSQFASAIQGSANVPNIQTGRTTSYAINNNIYSNYLQFYKNPEPYAGPMISSFDPPDGPIGTYVTIRGQGFGASKGTSKVYFGGTIVAGQVVGGTEASYDFPQICADSIWSDKQVLVKVPPGLANGNYPILMKIGTWRAIDTSALNPVNFIVNSDPLTPGLCKIEPVMGQVNTGISLWGEYFGAQNVSSRVRFHLSNYQAGADINSWVQGTAGNPDKVVTTVHLQAVTGLVRVVNSQGEGNGMNFAIGTCKIDSECGGAGNFCCPNGTPYVGKCKTDPTGKNDIQKACFPEYQSSVYEWNFSTVSMPVSCNKDLTNATCDADNNKCSPLTPICNPTTCLCQAENNCDLTTHDMCGDNTCCSKGGCKDFNIDGITECSDGLDSCSGFNQCLDTYFCPNSPGKCSPYQGGNPIETGDCNNNSCENFQKCQGGLCEYQPAPVNRCVVKTGAVCDMPKTVQDVNNRDIIAQCVNNKWQISTNLSCPDNWTNIGGGKCTQDNTTCDICATGFKCLANDVCAIDQAICPAGSSCNGSGKCTKTDSASCDCCCRKSNANQDCCAPLECKGACGAETSPSNPNFGLCTGCAGVGATQTEHNAACNCLGTSGKYCDTGAANGEGVCKDCAQLPTASSCTDLGAGVCCVDAKQSNACKGGTDTVFSGIPGDTNSYCSYYPCDNSTGTCGAAVASSTLPVYKTSDCDEKCTKAPAFGQSCAKVMPEPITQCDYSICSGFSCLTDSGTIPTTPPCGTCCCSPTADPDQCKAVNSILSCKADQSPCTGASRGLCCGCTDDLSCGSPSTTGCGSDACCHARPTVVPPTVPADLATNVCRNALIQATFDQTMDIGTFSGNVIVAGQYNADPCPAGTEYLTAVYKPTFFARVKLILAKIPLIKKLIISDAKAVVGNFCTVKGSVSGYNTAGNKTVLEFKLEKALAANRQYYVIIKGDSNTSDAVKEGVLSASGIGLLPTIPPTILNGIIYKGYAWKFTTRPDNGADNGICRIAYAKIEPASYLFQTNQDDTNDNAAGINFDKINDSDKLFVANAYAEDDTALNSVTGVYSWTWTWDDSGSTAFSTNLVPPPPEDKKNVIRTANNVTEAKTVITATANTSLSESFSAKAKVYLMVCNNPWPVVDPINGSWEPWSDLLPNYVCVANSGNCTDTNFEVYYCRDQGSSGTADDLPAILNQAVARGLSASAIKELFFFREGLPNVAGGFTAAALTEGSKVLVQWSMVSGASGYKLYYGTAKGKYGDPIKISNVNTLSYTVSGLTNKKTYYFAVTSYNDKGAESGYSNEATSSPADTLAPDKPVTLWVLPTASSTATISWTANNDSTATGTVSYKLYYGASNPPTGGVVSINKKTCSSSACIATISNLHPDITYYFAVSALDAAGNESAKSTSVQTKIKFSSRATDLVKLAQAFYLYADDHGGQFPSSYATSSYDSSCLGIPTGQTCWNKYQRNQPDLRFGIPGNTNLNNALAPYLSPIPLDPKKDDPARIAAGVGDAYIYYKGTVGFGCGFGPTVTDPNATWIIFQPDEAIPKGDQRSIAQTRCAELGYLAQGYSYICCSALGCGSHYYCAFRMK